MQPPKLEESAERTYTHEEVVKHLLFVRKFKPKESMLVQQFNHYLEEVITLHYLDNYDTPEEPPVEDDLNKVSKPLEEVEN